MGFQRPTCDRPLNLDHGVMTSAATDEDALPATETRLVQAHGLAALAMVAILGPPRSGRRAQVPLARLPHRAALAHLGPPALCPHAGHPLRLARQRLPRISLLRRAAALGPGGRLAERLGWLLFVVWNFLVVIPGWVLVQAGYSQPLEWAEFPIVDRRLRRARPSC